MYDVAHIGLEVKDAARSSRFYREVLGCTQVGLYQDDGVHLEFLQTGNQVIELVHHKTGVAESRPAGVVDHLAFKVADIEAEVAKLRRQGVTLIFDVPKAIMGGRQKIFFFAGPDGERLEFVQEISR